MEIKICYLQTALEIRTRYNICEATVSKKAKKTRIYECTNARNLYELFGDKQLSPYQF